MIGLETADVIAVKWQMASVTYNSLVVIDEVFRSAYNENTANGSQLTVNTTATPETSYDESQISSCNNTRDRNIRDLPGINKYFNCYNW